MPSLKLPSLQLPCLIVPGKDRNSDGGHEAIRLLHDEPTFSDLLSRNAQLQGDPVNELFNSTEKRLARMLLVLANSQKERLVQPVIPKISPEALAEIVGTTGSRINFFLKKFRTLGLIA
jgi:CRP/FNR family cyclic AMP-dependent transcriptional regulator